MQKMQLRADLTSTWEKKRKEGGFACPLPGKQTSANKQIADGEYSRVFQGGEKEAWAGLKFAR